MATSRKPPPPLTYAYLSAAAFVCALLVAALFIAFADRLAFITNAVYFVVLLPLALAAAAFLFGAMRSHARYRGTVIKGNLELGGPVVVFCLVMLGGLLLANPRATGSLTVRLVAADPADEPIDTGEVVLDLGDDRRTRGVGDDGQATFAQVPVQFLTGELEIMARVEHFRMTSPGPFRADPSGVVRVEMARVPDSTMVSGTISGPVGPVSGARINFENGRVIATSDENGNFHAALPVGEGSIVAVTVTLDGRTVYDDRYVVSGASGLRIAVREGEP